MKKALKKFKIRDSKSGTKFQAIKGRKNFLASETGTIIKKWGNKIPVCVVFPNTYYIGMSNLAVHILYKMLNSYDDILCERCFLGENNECISIESGRPLKSFKCIFFSLSFEMDFINIPKILSLSSIPVNSEERGNDDPLIVAGGICAISNPEPVHSFIDLFIMGDIESTIHDFMKKFRETTSRERDKIIDGLSEFDWVYNPRDLKVTYREDGAIGAFNPDHYIVKTRKYKDKTLGTSTIIAENTEFSSMFLVEGTRGCPSKCPFCLLGNSHRFICDKILPLETAVRDVGIMGGGVSFHPHLFEIVTELKRTGKRIHFPSLRLDEIPLSIIELMHDEIKTLTFGIEAGTEKLRTIIGKPLTDIEIYNKLGTILNIKPFNLKLYFMIGLPGETIEDIDSIVELVKKIKHVMIREGARKGSVGFITVHVSPFVPKPLTAFQRFPMNDMDELKSKINRLKKAIDRTDNTWFTHESVKYSFIQAVLSRGDRRLKNIVLQFAEGMNLNRIVRDSTVNLNFYALREKDKDEILPWDFIS